VVVQKANLSLKNRVAYISVIDETSEFKFGMQLGIAEAHHQIPPEENLVWSFNISATAEASDFTFGTQLRFAKAHHKTTPRENSGRGLGLGNLTKISGFPYISAMAEASNFKFGAQLGFAKDYHKITPREKGGCDRRWFHIYKAKKLHTVWENFTLLH